MKSKLIVLSSVVILSFAVPLTAQAQQCGYTTNGDYICPATRGVLGDLTGGIGDDLLGAAGDLLEGAGGLEAALTGGLSLGDVLEAATGGIGADDLLGGIAGDVLSGGFNLEDLSLSDLLSGDLSLDDLSLSGLGDILTDEAGGLWDDIMSGEMPLDLGDLTDVSLDELIGGTALDSIFGDYSEDILTHVGLEDLTEGGLFGGVGDMIGDAWEYLSGNEGLMTDLGDFSFTDFMGGIGDAISGFSLTDTLGGIGDLAGGVGDFISDQLSGIFEGPGASGGMFGNILDLAEGAIGSVLSSPQTIIGIATGSTSIQQAFLNILGSGDFSIDRVRDTLDLGDLAGGIGDDLLTG